MARELLLLRHGKSDWGTAQPDFERPLKSRGKRGAQRIGTWLWQHGLRPDTVVSSPAARAIETARLCCRSMDISADAVIEDERIYGASLYSLLTVLGELTDSGQRVMLVGHNPVFEDLLVYLAHRDLTYGSDGKLLPTATLARLSMPLDWSALRRGAARLLGLQRASELPERFPWPAPDGSELRKRPAYCYSRCVVIPYRINKSGKVEILLVGSGKNNHWTLPGGIEEPGMSMQASAVRVAERGAGVLGDVDDETAGDYEFSKWGAGCHVTVCALHVHTELGEAQWQRHRERSWLKVRQAADGLQPRELGAIVKSLAKRPGR